MNTSELNRPDNDDVAAWHRHFTAVTSWLLISGDLHPSTHLARQQLSEWVEAGVTDIVDARIEWSDAERVRRWEPQIRYWSLGAHDDGRHTIVGHTDWEMLRDHVVSRGEVFYQPEGRIVDIAQDE